MERSRVFKQGIVLHHITINHVLKFRKRVRENNLMFQKSRTLHRNIFVCFVLIFLISPWLSLRMCTCVSVQLCLIFCDSMDCSLPGSYLHEIFQTRVLEWVAFSCSRGSSQLRDPTLVSCVACTGIWILYHPTTWEALSFGKGNVTELSLTWTFH